MGGKHKGEPARGCTRDEFINMLKEVAVKKAQEKGIKRPILVFDNQFKGVHQQWEYVGLQHEDQMEPIPPYSPDFNKVIEHVHTNQETKLKSKLETKTAEMHPAGLKKLLEQSILEASNQRSIAKDVESMRDTWQAVVRNDGGYPIARHR